MALTRLRCRPRRLPAGQAERPPRQWPGHLLVPGVPLAPALSPTVG